MAIKNKPWGDQGNNTFLNPVLPADFSDLDVIRVGRDFYAISSTFQFSPGVVILHSKDLVNWHIIGHVANDLLQIGPEYNWNRMDRYGKGIWAGSIRYHDGKYWVYFCTPDEGFFMSTAVNPEGPWEPLHKMWGVAGWDDCCPLWDNDGQGYIVATHFADKYKVHLFKMSPDGRNILKASDSVIHQSHGSEANKLYKYYGLYYHLYSEVKKEGRVVMMERSQNIYGPYESRQLNHVNKSTDKEPNQGGIVQVTYGNWWFLTHQGTGDWEGRAACLLPVTWIDGWPIIGQAGNDTIGSMVWKSKKPFQSANLFSIQTSDEFNQSTLPDQWEWNYQPRKEMWSLTERSGFLRLHAFVPINANDGKDKRPLLFRAGNTLTQRSMRTMQSEATIRIEIGNMADGQTAGLCHFAGTYSTFGIKQSKGIRNLVYDNNSLEVIGPRINTDEIWLRSSWSIDGMSQYAYSFDGITFAPFGDPYKLTWGNYRGDRIGIYCYNRLRESGYIDVDWFHYKY
ncbi:MAG: glycoside hydrolase 43 family protein [Bacteroidota bacterium]|nr:glycoside hydrolase 43 family protein [Bacteroidota bacterium]